MIYYSLMSQKKSSLPNPKLEQDPANKTAIFYTMQSVRTIVKQLSLNKEKE